MKKKLIKKIGGLLFLLLLFVGSPTFASLNVTFSEPLPINRISFYWSGDSTAADQGGRTINSSPAATISMAPGFQAKAYSGSPPATVYAFASDVAEPRSQSIYIRVWETEGHDTGSHYTALWGSGGNNPWGGAATDTITIAYSFVKAVPAKPRISSIVVATTTNLLATPVPTTIGSTTFSSIQPAASAPNIIEAGSAQWQYKRNGGDWVTVAGENLVLAGDLIAHPGDRYEIQVMRTNVWGPGQWSDSYYYTVGAAPVGVTPPAGTGEVTGVVAPITPITYNLVHPAGLLGINPIAVQYNSLTSPVTGNQVRNVVEAINTAASGRNHVTAIGWWDIANQRPAGYIMNYSGGATNYIPIGGVAAGGSQALSDVPNGIYQISLENVTTGTGEVITFTGTR